VNIAECSARRLQKGTSGIRGLFVDWSVCPAVHVFIRSQSHLTATAVTQPPPPPLPLLQYSYDVYAGQ